MKNILMTGQTYDVAGYGEAFRNYIAALSLYPEEINLSIKTLKFEKWVSEHSKYKDIVGKLENKVMAPDIQFIHSTPENFPVYKRSNIKNIGYCTWETNKLPPAWVPLCNTMDQLMVPCDWNIEVFKNSGVTVPVTKIEHTIDMSQFNNIKPLDLGIPKDKFIFYSIFQWTERKNPEGLIKAFLSEFSKDDNVVLVLKTYRQNNTDQDKKWIEQEIIKIKQSMYIDNHAPVMVIHKMLTRDELLSLHKSGDCLVMPHKAEGWSCSHFEAMALGKPAIGTNYGGNTEFMTNDNSYLLDYHLTPVANMPWKLYSGKMQWAEPNLSQLQKYMRSIYTNYDQALLRGAQAQIDLQKYSWANMGRKIISELNNTLAGDVK